MRGRLLCLFWTAALLTFPPSGCSCEAGTSADGGSGEGGGNGAADSGNGAGFQTGGNGGGSDNCLAEAELVYVLSYERQLYSFDPNLPGLQAYKLIGTLDCQSIGSPQSMSVDKNGIAYVFYDSGELFRVSTLDASCNPTTYVHPVPSAFNQLGMGFTATSPDAFDDQLFVVSPDFGLATIAFPSHEVSELGGLLGAAELTGGPDAKLFHFAADSASLSEVSVASLTTTPMHTFNGLQGTQAWAFSRYAGNFYMFTSAGVGFGSTCTIFDPVANAETERDADIGFTVVGAGQSICVPPPVPQ